MKETPSVTYIHYTGSLQQNWGHTGSLMKGGQFDRNRRCTFLS